MGEDDNIKKISLKDQPFAAPEKLQDVVAETYKLLKKSLPNLQKSMALYLANRETEIILFKPIKVGVFMKCLFNPFQHTTNLQQTTLKISRQ